MQNIVVLGGGAAGFFGAINCAIADPSSKVTILEKSNKLLSKVRISGGGRCNVTHACFEYKELVKNYPRGEKELLGPFNRFSATDTLQWFENRGVKLKTENDGRMFPTTDNSATIIDCLLNEAHKYGVVIKTGVDVSEIKKVKDKFTLLANTGTIECDKLLIATGGSNKSSGYEIITGMGHSISPPVPSLFTFNVPSESITALMGTSVPNALIKIQGSKLESSGALLITHWGFSGPAVLKLSAWAARYLSEKNYDFAIKINWLHDMNEDKVRQIISDQKKQSASKNIHNIKPFELPSRLWEYFLKRSAIPEGTKMADISNKQLYKLSECLSADLYHVKGKTTFKEEFVTCGGLNLKEVDMKTMQSKLIPGLYFAGEVLNIDGITGGFNFQNAWTSGWIASQHMAV